MVRIANCSGFYGDRLSAANEQVMGGEIDFLTGDYLAELTMLILFKDRMKNSDGGYAKTFPLQLKDILQPALERNIKIVVNAGGLNPTGLAKAVREVSDKLGLSPKVATVEGDNVLPKVFDWQAEGLELAHLNTGQPLSSANGQILAANAYLGCWPIVRALEAGADIVITGRCTDAAVVMAPAAWRHGWSPTDYDALAGALIAGHIIECGCQATGGNYSFFEEVPSFHNVGFPIAEIDSDGSSVITKHPGTGGLVSIGTVTAQLMYEIQTNEYHSPDAVARIDSVQLKQLAPDRVHVSGVVGQPPTEWLKLGINLAAGWRNRVRIVLGSHEVERKAAIVNQTFWPLVGGKESFIEARTDLYRQQTAVPSTSGDLAFLELSVRDSNERKVGQAFSSKAIELALASVPGITLAELPGRPQGCGVFWPTLIHRDHVKMTVQIDDELITVSHPDIATTAPKPIEPPNLIEASESGKTVKIPLGTLVGTRSGDKGGNANVGFWVRDQRHYAWLADYLDEARLRGWLESSGFSGNIQRFEFPNLLAINFILEGILGDGVASNLHPDPQAKCLGEYFRSQLVEVDAALVE